MPYAYIIAVLALFGAGFATSHQFDKAELESLRNTISRANAEADMQLEIAKRKVQAADLRAADDNHKIEVSHAQHIQTINALHDQLVAARLPTGHQDCRDTLPTSASAEQSDGKTEHRELPTSFDQLVKTEALRADTVAAYADACHAFISNNCGISKGE